MLSWCVAQLWEPAAKKCGKRPSSDILLTAWACLVQDNNALSDCLSSRQNIHCIILSNDGDRSLSLSNAILGVFEVLCTINHEWQDAEDQSHSRVTMQLQPELEAPEFNIEAQALELAFKVYNDLGCDRSAFVHG